jgi:Methyltransferase FkbM domain
MAAAGLEQVSFLKLDVEGAELATLRGFEQTLRERRILAMQFEHGEPSVESRTFLRDIVRFLALFDFTCFTLYPQSLERVDQYGYRMEDFRGRNYVALSPSLARSLDGILLVPTSVR